MRAFPVFGDEASPNSSIKKIIQGAVGTPIILSTQPTTANGLVPEGEMGIYNNDLYHTSNGVTLKFGGVVV